MGCGAVAAGDRRYGPRGHEVVAVQSGECGDSPPRRAARKAAPSAGAWSAAGAPASSSQVPRRDVALQWDEARVQEYVRELHASGRPACRRLAAELAELAAPAAPGAAGGGGVAAGREGGAFAAPREGGDLLSWLARLPGPVGTPYEGGVFLLALEFPEEYPMRPPRVEFVTPCYHPNVGLGGKICLNILKEEWTPLLTVSSLLLCLSANLSCPRPEDALNEGAAELLRRRPEEFDRRARELTRTALPFTRAVGGAAARGASPRVQRVGFAPTPAG